MVISKLVFEVFLFDRLMGILDSLVRSGEVSDGAEGLPVHLEEHPVLLLDGFHDEFDTAVQEVVGVKLGFPIPTEAPVGEPSELGAKAHAVAGEPDPEGPVAHHIPDGTDEVSNLEFCDAEGVVAVLRFDGLHDHVQDASFCDGSTLNERGRIQFHHFSSHSHEIHGNGTRWT